MPLTIGLPITRPIRKQSRVGAGVAVRNLLQRDAVLGSLQSCVSFFSSQEIAPPPKYCGPTRRLLPLLCQRSTLASPQSTFIRSLTCTHEGEHRQFPAFISNADITQWRPITEMGPGLNQPPALGISSFLIIVTVKNKGSGLRLTQGSNPGSGSFQPSHLEQVDCPFGAQFSYR